MIGGDLETNPNSSVTCYRYCTCPERVAYLQEWGPLLHLLLVQCLGLRAMSRGLSESCFRCTKVDLLSLLVRPAPRRWGIVQQGLLFSR